MQWDKIIVMVAPWVAVAAMGLAKSSYAPETALAALISNYLVVRYWH